MTKDAFAAYVFCEKRIICKGIKLNLGVWNYIVLLQELNANLGEFRPEASAQETESLSTDEIMDII